MSRTTSDLKATPVIDTSKLGTIQIKLNLEGSVIDKSIKFVPGMVSNSLKGDTVYFPMTTAISDSIILNALPDIQDPRFMLTKLSDFSRFMYYATDPIRYKPIVLGSSIANSIIEGNIQYIVNVLFKKYIQINGRAYKILSKKIKSDETSYPKKKTDSLVANVTVILELIDRKNDTIEGRTRQSCRGNRADINKTYIDLFQRPFFAKRADELAPRGVDERLSPLYSSVTTGTTTGTTMGTTQKTPSSRDAYQRRRRRQMQYSPPAYAYAPAPVPIKNDRRPNTFGGTKRKYRVRMSTRERAVRRDETRRRARKG